MIGYYKILILWDKKPQTKGGDMHMYVCLFVNISSLWTRFFNKTCNCFQLLYLPSFSINSHKTLSQHVWRMSNLRDRKECLFWLWFCLKWGLPGGPGWPWTCCLAQSNLEFKIPHFSFPSTKIAVHTQPRTQLRCFSQLLVELWASFLGTTVQVAATFSEGAPLWTGSMSTKALILCSFQSRGVSHTKFTSPMHAA